MLKNKSKVKISTLKQNRDAQCGITNPIKEHEVMEKVSEMVKSVINREIPKLSNNTLLYDLVMNKLVFKK